MKLFAFALLAALVTQPMNLEPTRIQSRCKGGLRPNVHAMIRVLRTFEDGARYKSLPGPFEYRAAAELLNYGGAVGYWPVEAFDAPRTLAQPRRNGWTPFALAIPDDGDPRFSHRFLFLGWRSTNGDIWSTESSTDKENVCK